MNTDSPHMLGALQDGAPAAPPHAPGGPPPATQPPLYPGAAGDATGALAETAPAEGPEGLSDSLLDDLFDEVRPATPPAAEVQPPVPPAQPQAPPPAAPQAPPQAATQTPQVTPQRPRPVALSQAAPAAAPQTPPAAPQDVPRAAPAAAPQAPPRAAPQVPPRVAPKTAPALQPGAPGPRPDNIAPADLERLDPAFGAEQGDTFETPPRLVLALSSPKTDLSHQESDPSGGPAAYVPFPKGEADVSGVEVAQPLPASGRAPAARAPEPDVSGVEVAWPRAAPPQAARTVPAAAVVPAVPPEHPGESDDSSVEVVMPVRTGRRRGPRPLVLPQARPLPPRAPAAYSVAQVAGEGHHGGAYAFVTPEDDGRLFQSGTGFYCYCAQCGGMLPVRGNGAQVCPHFNY